MTTLTLYAGIGSRTTPQYVLDHMYGIAYQRAHTHVLRSGRARGADTAFENGARNGRGQTELFTADSQILDWAFETVDRFHPAPDRLSDYARRLHARNAMILLGADGETPVQEVICWTPGGAVTGGTGQALRIAAAHDIQITNLWGL